MRVDSAPVSTESALFALRVPLHIGSSAFLISILFQAAGDYFINWTFACITLLMSKSGAHIPVYRTHVFKLQKSSFLLVIF